MDMHVHEATRHGDNPLTSPAAPGSTQPASAGTFSMRATLVLCLLAAAISAAAAAPQLTLNATTIANGDYVKVSFSGVAKPTIQVCSLAINSGDDRLRFILSSKSYFRLAPPLPLVS